MGKTLAQLEKKERMKVPSEDESFLVRRVYHLQNKLLDDFSVEDIRLMVGQNEGLEYLIPLALDILDTELFAEGDYYPGDLLKNVLSVPRGYWVAHLDQKLRLLEICQLQWSKLEEVDIIDDLREEIEASYHSFIS